MGIYIAFISFSDRFLPDKAIDLIDEAGSRVRLRHAQVLSDDFSDYKHLLHCSCWFWALVLQLPDEAKELDKELRQISKQKNEAVRGQDFEKVYYCLTMDFMSMGSNISINKHDMLQCYKNP